MGYRVKGDREKGASVAMCEKHLSKEWDKELKKNEGKRVNDKEREKYKEMKELYRSEKGTFGERGHRRNGIIPKKGRVGQNKTMNVKSTSIILY